MKYLATHLTALFPAFPGKTTRNSFHRRFSTFHSQFQFPSVSPLSTALTPNSPLSPLSTALTHFDRGVGVAKRKRAEWKRRAPNRFQLNSAVSHAGSRLWLEWWLVRHRKSGVEPPHSKAPRDGTGYVAAIFRLARPGYARAGTTARSAALNSGPRLLGNLRTDTRVGWRRGWRGLDLARCTRLPTHAGRRNGVRDRRISFARVVLLFLACT